MKHRIQLGIFCFIISGLLLNSATISNNYSVRDWIAINQKIILLQQKGQGNFQKGNYEKAINNFQEILSNNPEDMQAKTAFQKAASARQQVNNLQDYYKSGNYQGTLEAIAELEKLNPQDKNHVLLKQNCQKIIYAETQGDSAFAKAQYNQAIEHYSGIKRINQADTRSTVKIEKCRSILETKESAWQYFSAGDYRKARDQYQNILTKNPADSYAAQGIKDCSQALSLIAQADNSINKYDFSAAFDFLNAVVSLNPKDQTALKRTVDYKRIIDYYEVNQDLRSASFYKEILGNYEKMQEILPNNLKLSNEMRRFQQCQNLKVLGFASFSSENYQEAANCFQKVLEYNPLDELTSRNLAIVNYAIQLKEKAQNKYSGGNYEESLNIYRVLSGLNLTQNNLAEKTELEFQRGIPNSFILNNLPDGLAAVSLIVNNQTIPLNRTTEGWNGIVSINRNELEGFKTAKIYLRDTKNKTVSYFLPYLVQDNQPTAPVGYTPVEQDIQL